MREIIVFAVIFIIIGYYASIPFIDRFIKKRYHKDLSIHLITAGLIITAVLAFICVRCFGS